MSENICQWILWRSDRVLCRFTTSDREAQEELGLTIDLNKIEKLFTASQQRVMHDGKSCQEYFG